MAEQMSTPRITAPYLDNFVGRVIMLVGKVTQLRGDQATLDSDGTVTVLLNREAHLANGNGVQVIGKVNPDLSIKVLTSRDLGTGVDHGSPQSSQPAYTPRVAMVWTSPPKTQPPPSRCQHFSAKSPASITPYRDTKSKDRMPQHVNTPMTAGRIQDRPRSAYVSGRPSTASSFTTSSSSMTYDRKYPSRSPSPSSDENRSYLSRTPTPTPHMLPSPPQESAFSSQRTDESCLIPSAQPYTPIIPHSPQVFSASSAAASLPSPPPSQPLKPTYEDSAPSTPKNPSPRVIRPHRTTRSMNPVPSSPDLDDSELMNCVLDGIGRIHVTMGKDEAGRWRIKRADNDRP